MARGATTAGIEEQHCPGSTQRDRHAEGKIGNHRVFFNGVGLVRGLPTMVEIVLPQQRLHTKDLANDGGSARRVEHHI